MGKGQGPRITRRFQRVMWPVLSSVSHQPQKLGQTKQELGFKPWDGKLPQKHYQSKSEQQEGGERVPSAQELRSPENARDVGLRSSAALEGKESVVMMAT